MKLEDQVVSLEWAKKMKEAGFKQESLWYWSIREYHRPNENPVIVHSSDRRPSNTVSYISAYTVAELGEILPMGFYTRKCIQGFLPSHYEVTSLRKEYLELLNNTEANARASMACYLREEGEI